ncbi:hypothetical protein EMCG_03835 [[Emmonsia] crescens]|uniref:Aminoglycoside phosphotransferase domain-containing protein n=1 Tax=[Emmonsia] crescens TaxID=73230 RepID=A0A0G2HV56_9EURO|nr:hypothetical protein EMCG_03835 [Emmonsia crescens UAMH 3008]
MLSISQGQPEILQPLAPQVTALLQQYSYQGCKLTGHDICSALSGALKSGKVLWSHFARAVVQLDEQIIVKLGPNISLIDANMTAHIRKHSADIPVPQPLGTLSLGGKVYSFMSLMEGRPLDKLWPDLSSTDKFSVRDQLDAILEKLRLLPLPSKYLGGGNPPQCIDCRGWKRKSPESMESEAQFNEFLLSGNSRPSMEPYVEFVRPMLRENHRIVLTHGDLHPRNILAINDKEGGGIRITGLIDWEVGGAYPEYWEFVKSLNTVRPIRLGDWPFFLPLKGMGKYFEEYAIDCLIDNYPPLVFVGDFQDNTRRLCLILILDLDFKQRVQLELRLIMVIVSKKIIFNQALQHVQDPLLAGLETQPYSKKLTSFLPAMLVTIDLPQLIVVGDQSSSKSSVLEGLIKLPFPHNSGLCTKFTTQIIFRRAFITTSIAVSIISKIGADPEYVQKLKEWRADLQ